PTILRPGPAGPESPTPPPLFFLHILELAIAEVAVKRIPAVTGYVQVLPAIIVKVSDRHPHSPAFDRQTGVLGYIRKLEICILVIERNHWISTLPIVVDGRSIHGDDA